MVSVKTLSFVNKHKNSVGLMQHNIFIKIYTDKCVVLRANIAAQEK